MTDELHEAIAKAARDLVEAAHGVETLVGQHDYAAAWDSLRALFDVGYSPLEDALIAWDNHQLHGGEFKRRPPAA